MNGLDVDEVVDRSSTNDRCFLFFCHLSVVDNDNGINDLNSIVDDEVEVGDHLVDIDIDGGNGGGVGGMFMCTTMANPSTKTITAAVTTMMVIIIVVVMARAIVLTVIVIIYPRVTVNSTEQYITCAVMVEVCGGWMVCGGRRL